MMQVGPSDGVVRAVPDRLTDVTSWHTHIPFAFWCVEALRPRVIVELGTHRGDSYCAFCQAVDRLLLPTSCFAVDTWRGDPQAGVYGEEIYEELRKYHDPRYGKFSRLIRSTFDDAVSSFDDGSIDLLHIDGLHTREATQHDFDTWLPKLSRSAVVLFHDTNVRAPGFGVSHFWDEMRARHPHFTFFHGHGLGVLLVGGDPPEPARRLAASSPEEAAHVRALFARLGSAVAETAERRKTEPGLARDAGRAHRTQQLSRRIAQGAKLGLDVLYWAATFQLHAGLRRLKYARLIRSSGLFQPDHYLAQLVDPAGAARDPVWHYLVRGAAEGLDPNPFFDTSYYVARCPDAGAPGKNPLVHFIRSDPMHAANPGPAFDNAFYLTRYPDVAASGMIPLAHHLAHGAARGRICTPASQLPEPARARALSDELAERAATLVPDGGPGRVLVVDQWILTPDQDSGSVRMFAILKLLRELGHEVTFVSENEELRPRYADDIRALGIEIVQGYVPAVEHLAAEGHRYRFSWLSRPEVYHRFLPAVRAHAIHAAVIYDTVDLHWVRMGRAADLTSNASLRKEAERFRTIERLGANCADIVLAITPEEQAALRVECPGARVEVLPNIHRCRPSARPWADRKDLMFIGGYDHTPNIDAVEWFVKEILPRVQRRLPDVVLHVIGSKPPPALRRLASDAVDVVGYVQDVEPLFQENRVFVAPLRYGAGMKGKIGHAMSHGLPLVTTSIGAEGMKIVDGETALVADDADTFAAAVVRLYEDELLWSRLARESVRHVQENFSHEAICAHLRALLALPGTAESTAPQTESSDHS